MNNVWVSVFNVQWNNKLSREIVGFLWFSLKQIYSKSLKPRKNDHGYFAFDYVNYTSNLWDINLSVKAIIGRSSLEIEYIWTF